MITIRVTYKNDDVRFINIPLQMQGLLSICLDKAEHVRSYRPVVYGDIQ